METALASAEHRNVPCVLWLYRVSVQSYTGYRHAVLGRLYESLLAYIKYWI